MLGEEGGVWQDEAKSLASPAKKAQPALASRAKLG